MARIRHHAVVDRAADHCLHRLRNAVILQQLVRGLRVQLIKAARVGAKCSFQGDGKLKGVTRRIILPINGGVRASPSARD